MDAIFTLEEQKGRKSERVCVCVLCNDVIAPFQSPVSEHITSTTAEESVQLLSNTQIRVNPYRMLSSFPAISTLAASSFRLCSKRGAEKKGGGGGLCTALTAGKSVLETDEDSFQFNLSVRGSAGPTRP